MCTVIYSPYERLITLATLKLESFHCCAHLTLLLIYYNYIFSLVDSHMIRQFSDYIVA